MGGQISWKSDDGKAFSRTANEMLGHHIYLFVLLLTCSFAIICLHYKHSQANEGFHVTIGNVDCFCASETSQSTYDYQPTSEEISDAKECRSSPSSMMEQTRRHISQTAHHQWLFLRHQIRILRRILKINSSTQLPNLQKYENTLKYMSDHVSDFSRVIDLELKKLASFDGWDSWRKKESMKLRQTVRERLIKLQNPHNCSEPPILVCNLTNPFGFASGIHDVLWCFIKAYSTQRRLVIATTHWHYAPDGWETLFQPLSETCQDNLIELQEISPWPGENNNKARWLMRTMPKDLGTKIIKLHGNPLAWWYGQFLWYLMRPNDHLQSFINSTLKNINFSKGIVGIHVRRTDKVGNEARAHRLEEYMEHAEGYFQSLELVSLQRIKRRVYIATDEPSVLKECHSKYPQYECLYNPGSAEMASNLDTRYSNQSFWCLVTDIFVLSQTDFIVCTMSSGVCRVAYELKLAMDESSPDASDKVSSLDIPHHYAWITPAARKAIYNHNSKSQREMGFERGDVLIHKNDHTTVQAATKGKGLDGFMKMINKMQNTEGLIPIYKTREMFQLTHFP